MYTDCADIYRASIHSNQFHSLICSGEIHPEHKGVKISVRERPMSEIVRGSATTVCGAHTLPTSDSIGTRAQFRSPLSRTRNLQGPLYLTLQCGPSPGNTHTDQSSLRLSLCSTASRKILDDSASAHPGIVQLSDRFSGSRATSVNALVHR
jgi:hypothetical protein